MTIKLGNRIYQFGKRKCDGKYVILENGKELYVADTFKEQRNNLKKIKKNYFNRLKREEIKTITGVSYSAAMRDMGY